MNSAFRNWSDVRVFLAVLRAGSTLAASKTLGMAQPTVARRIEALEHTLGVTLFERSTLGFRPTPDAQALVKVAERLEAAATDLSEQATTLKAVSSGVIRLTAPDSVFTSQFSEILEDFVERYGDVQFEFIRRYEVVDLAAGEADVALRFSQKIHDQSLICRKLTEIKGVLVASKNYAAKHGIPTSVDELNGHKFVTYKGDNVPHLFNNWLLDRIDASQVAMSCKDIASLGSAVEMGAGIGPLPTRDAKSRDKVVVCFELPPETRISSWLLVSSAAYCRPEIKAFTAFFAPRYSALFREN